MTHKHLLQAIKVASTSTERQRHGAVIAKGGRVLSVGVNTRRNHPDVCSDPKTEASFHAEVMALRALSSPELAQGATLYVARINRNQLPADSTPCVNCLNVIINSGIKKVVAS